MNFPQSLNLDLYLHLSYNFSYLVNLKVWGVVLPIGYEQAGVCLTPGLFGSYCCVTTAFCICVSRYGLVSTFITIGVSFITVGFTSLPVPVLSEDFVMSHTTFVFTPLDLICDLVYTINVSFTMIR